MVQATTLRAIACAGALCLLFALPARAQSVFINEIHYDNDGADLAEAVEIAGPAGTDLTGYSLVLYNGADSELYDSGATIALSGIIPDLQNGYGTIAFLTPGLQNGAPDGIALVGPSGLIQFLSYEGSFTAVGGPADGLTSTDIGVSEGTSTPIGQSLQLTGTGAEYADFTWAAPATATFFLVNNNQTFVAPLPTADQKISPVLDSLVTNCDGTFTAFFGYLNRNSITVTVPAGADNRFSPAPEDRGQTTDFLPGRHRKVFAVTFPSGNIVWTLKSPNGQQATATAGSGAALPATGCNNACNDDATLPSYAGGYLLNFEEDRAAIETSTPTGGLVFMFYNTSNLVIGDPEEDDFSTPPSFSRSGNTFTFDASTPSPEFLYFPITRADPNVAGVSFFLKITDTCGRIVDVDPQFALTSVASELEAATTLSAAQPNPFAAQATITFSLAEAADVRLRVFDVLGREVASLASGVHAAGLHEATFEASGLPSGLYLYRLEAAGQTLQRTMTLTR